MPGIGRRREGSPGSLEDVEHMSLERLSISIPLHSGAQFLCHDNAEMFERREHSVEALENVVGNRVAEGVDEELRIEGVLPWCLDHDSRSADMISTPSIARVPSTSSR